MEQALLSVRYPALPGSAVKILKLGGLGRAKHLNWGLVMADE